MFRLYYTEIQQHKNVDLRNINETLSEQYIMFDNDAVIKFNEHLNHIQVMMLPL